jgi:hypothetical protein
MIFPCERSIFRGDFKYGGSRNHLTFRETFHVFFFWIDYISRLVPIQSYSIWVVSPTTDCKLMAPSLCLQPWWSCDVHKIQKINMRSSLFIGILAKIPEKTRRRYIYIFIFKWDKSPLSFHGRFLDHGSGFDREASALHVLLMYRANPEAASRECCGWLQITVKATEHPLETEVLYIYTHIYIYTGCWFQTFFCFP